MAKNDDADAKLIALRKAGFTGPIDRHGNAVMSRTDNRGRPLPLFKGGSGHGTRDDKRR
jgi:hypothetical protein